MVQTLASSEGAQHLVKQLKSHMLCDQKKKSQENRDNIVTYSIKILKMAYIKNIFKKLKKKQTLSLLNAYIQDYSVTPDPKQKSLSLKMTSYVKEIAILTFIRTINFTLVSKGGKLADKDKYKNIQRYFILFSSVQSLSHVLLCNPMDCSTPCLSIHHQLPEFTQTHVH